MTDDDAIINELMHCNVGTEELCRRLLRLLQELRVLMEIVDGPDDPKIRTITKAYRKIRSMFVPPKPKIRLGDPEDPSFEIKEAQLQSWLNKRGRFSLLFFGKDAVLRRVPWIVEAMTSASNVQTDAYHETPAYKAWKRDYNRVRIALMRKGFKPLTAAEKAKGLDNYAQDISVTVLGEVRTKRCLPVKPKDSK